MRQPHKIVKHFQNNSSTICLRIVWVRLTILWGLRHFSLKELKRFKRCLPCFYLYHVYIRILITNITNFLYFHMISDSFVSNFFFFFLNLFISIVCWKSFGKHFHTASTSVYIMIIFYTFKWQNCRHWKNPMEYIDLLLFYMNF